MPRSERSSKYKRKSKSIKDITKFNARYIDERRRDADYSQFYPGHSRERTLRYLKSVNESIKAKCKKGVISIQKDMRVYVLNKAFQQTVEKVRQEEMDCVDRLNQKKADEAEYERIRQYEQMEKEKKARREASNSPEFADIFGSLTDFLCEAHNYNR